tara:strand:+ start:193 stop:1122 length:930 start_codon:yes stop_codon:yes gene_type:complete
MFKVATLYKFARVAMPEDLQKKIKAKLKELNIYGTILVGDEGLNGTISGKENDLINALSFIKKIPGFSDLDIKHSASETKPFMRLKVKLKEEIVTIGDKYIDPVNQAGKYVESSEWNELIKNPNTILIDTRNNYEYSIGTFKDAINPETETFREFPQWVKKQKFSKQDKKNKNIAMFCTGGIRCEKASSFMKLDGFDNVYHLKGGILKYLEETPSNESLWQGECFVFDDRVSVQHDLSEGTYDMCHGCRMPITENDKKSKKYVRGVSCPNCFNSKTLKQVERYKNRQKQIDLAKSRNQKHIGPKEVIRK